MANVFTRKLELFGLLPDSDRRLLDDTISRFREIPAHSDLIREGDRPADVRLVLEGVACRYKMLPDGRRQIFAYLLPGDFCDLHTFLLKTMDHTIATLSECTTVNIPRDRVLQLCARPQIARALWWATLVDEAILREWVVNLGTRNASQRVAHLFCELHLRFKSIGLIDDEHFQMPITQAELGDTLGLSSVHVNRTLQTLRRKELITFRSQKLVILDLRGLRELCGFNQNYLHLDGGKEDSPLAAYTVSS